MTPCAMHHYQAFHTTGPEVPVGSFGVREGRSEQRLAKLDCVLVVSPDPTVALPVAPLPFPTLLAPSTPLEAAASRLPSVAFTPTAPAPTAPALHGRCLVGLAAAGEWRPLLELAAAAPRGDTAPRLLNRGALAVAMASTQGFSGDGPLIFAPAGSGSLPT